ncbi:acyl-ACP--UDP-N-acetylglucosamine O-acyltransferase [Thalassotalea piscium]
MIHEQAIIEAGAQIGKNVTIGPWTYISKDVVIGDNCHISSNVVINGPTRMGKGNRIFQFASIGEDCQDLKYAGEATELVIGDNNTFRECCTVHRGTVQDKGLTSIGSNNLFMAYTHIAHDCVVGDNCIMANNASIAGHVHVGDYAILGGMSGIHQFCHVGAHSFVAANSLVVKDVPPYIMAAGDGAKPFGLNSEGLKRRGFSAEAISTIKKAYRILYRQSLTIDDALEKISHEITQSEELVLFTDFVKSSSRGIIR